MSNNGKDPDDSSKQGFCAFFEQLPEKSGATIRFFDRSDYYTVHGDDALFAAKEIFKTASVIKYWGGDKLPSVSLSNLVFENTLRELLLVRGFRVEVYTSTSQRGNGTWTLSKRASPGNVQQFEDVLFTSNTTSAGSSPIVMAVKLASVDGNRVLGVAYADSSLCRLGVAEFTDNDQFSNFEALAVQLGARECLITVEKGNLDAARLVQIAERTKCLVTARKRSDFTSKDIKQDVERLLKLKEGTSISSVKELELEQAMGALACVIKYLELLADETNFGQFSISTFNFSQYMRIDAAASSALHVFPTQGATGQTARSQSIYGLLNRCKTPQGQRLLQQWLKQPLIDRARISERHDMVELFFEDQELRMSLADTIRRFPDMNRLAKKFLRGKATLKDCVQAYHAVCVIPTVVEACRNHEGANKALLEELIVRPFEAHIEDFENLRKLVETTVDLASTDNHEYLIKPEFDERMQQARDAMDELCDKVPTVLRKAASDLGLEADKSIKIDKDAKTNNFVFRITRSHEKKLRGNRKYETLETLKNGVKFTNAALNSINSDYKENHEIYEEVQKAVVDKVVDIVQGYTDPMETLNDVVALLDVFIGLATAASEAPTPYVRPKLRDMGHGGIDLVASRHPCVEVQDGINFIANDVHLTRDAGEFQIITGPNMGGKSTYIRQVGVACLMAQIGSFVPADEAEMEIVDSILARVGAGDSQLKGISTFMAEMLETASILKAATKHSLIIIDELGRGTSTYDGFGLAWAISEHIATDIKGLCLFATHFHELTALADRLPNVRNLHVDAIASKDSLTLLYKVKEGVCDRSFGIHVAELASFPEEVVQAARRKAKELEDFESTGAATAAGDASSAEEPATKRAKTEKQRASELLADFAARTRQLAEQNLTPEKLKQTVCELRDEVLREKNAYIAKLLNSA